MLKYPLNKIVIATLVLTQLFFYSSCASLGMTSQKEKIWDNIEFKNEKLDSYDLKLLVKDFEKSSLKLQVYRMPVYKSDKITTTTSQKEFSFWSHFWWFIGDSIIWFVPALFTARLAEHPGQIMDDEKAIFITFPIFPVADLIASSFYYIPNKKDNSEIVYKRKQNEEIFSNEEMQISINEFKTKLKTDQDGIINLSLDKLSEFDLNSLSDMFEHLPITSNMIAIKTGNKNIKISQTAIEKISSNQLKMINYYTKQKNLLLKIENLKKSEKYKEAYNTLKTIDRDLLSNNENNVLENFENILPEKIASDSYSFMERNINNYDLVKKEFSFVSQKSKFYNKALETLYKSEYYDILRQSNKNESNEIKEAIERSYLVSKNSPYYNSLFSKISLWKKTKSKLEIEEKEKYYQTLFSQANDTLNSGSYEESIRIFKQIPKSSRIFKQAQNKINESNSIIKYRNLQTKKINNARSKIIVNTDGQEHGESWTLNAQTRFEYGKWVHYPAKKMYTQTGGKLNYTVKNKSNEQVEFSLNFYMKTKYLRIEYNICNVSFNLKPNTQVSGYCITGTPPALLTPGEYDFFSVRWDWFNPSDFKIIN